MALDGTLLARIVQQRKVSPSYFSIALNGDGTGFVALIHKASRSLMV